MSLHRAGERHPGGDPDAGVATRHAFSFGPHYDPDNLRFGALVACNEERLAPGAGFDEHPHSHTEIVTWVVEGELTHRDSTGHATAVRPGDLQHLGSAGGVRHVERNDGAAPLVFVQMWLAPWNPAATRRTGSSAASPTRPLRGARRRRDAPRAPPGRGRARHRPGRGLRVRARGARRGPADRRRRGVGLSPGDAARITDARGVRLTALTPAEVLVWEMTRPAPPS